MKYFYFLCILFFYISLNAQVGINNTDPKATLDITAKYAASPSNTDGLLIPRLSKLPNPSPTAAQNGMLIYLTTANGGFEPGFLYWDQTIPDWVAINTGANTGKGWELDGNDVKDTDFFGTTNNKPIKIYTNNTPQFSFTTDGQLAFNKGIEIGDGSITGASGTIAIGSNKNVFFSTNADGIGSIAIGQAAQTVEDRSIAIGSVSKASKANAIAIGNQALASGNGSYAIGSLAKANNLRALSFGSLSTSNGDYAVSIGNSSGSTGESAIALGDRSDASATKSIAIGRDAASSANNSTAIGLNAQSSGSNAIAFGSQTEATMSNTLAIGSLSKATAIGAIALGSSTLAQDNYSFAAGFSAKARGESSIAIGELAETISTTYGTIAIGAGSKASEDNGIAIGSNANANLGAIAMGDTAEATGNRSLALGDFAKALSANSIAIGNGTNAPNANTLILGNGVNVGIGTNNPQEKLQVNGKIRYVDGTQAAGKVMTSDANGTATWQPITGIPQIVAAGVVEANGSTLKLNGATVSRINLGDYQITFTSPRASANYIINLTTIDCKDSADCPFDDPGISYYDRTTTGFKVNIGDSDNGGDPKTDIDLEFSFSVIDF